jgi:uncharacterized membrane protein YraQ (UPF0718 family)
MVKKIFTDKFFLIFSGIAFLVGLLCYANGGKETFFRGADASVSMLLMVLPRITAAFILAGFAQVLMPKDLIRTWIGEDSGLRGIIIATIAGVVTPSGPMISFPLVAALFKLGADYGPLIAYLTSWELLGFMRIAVWEIPFMGMKFAIIRGAASLLLPILAGLLAKKIVEYFGHSLQIERRN